MSGFYQTNNKVLAFDISKKQDMLYIIFNHLLCRKENLQRLNKDLPKGAFYLTTSIVEKDLNIDNNKAKRLIRDFVNMKIITPLEKSKSKYTSSIYAYNSVFYAEKNDPVDDPVDDPVNDPVKPSNTKGCEGSSDPVSDPVNDPVNDPSKKEYIKKNNKKGEMGVEIVEYLNGKLGTKFKATAKVTKGLINARLDEGYSLEDFKIVIDKKYREWNETEMRKFLRPQTLFGDKFETYLNQLEEVNNKTNIQEVDYDKRCYGF